ncbi:CapA family protein [Aliikangiella coralliicola]|nr:CapA family protein [Aliikangiella coralliicola]
MPISKMVGNNIITIKIAMFLCLAFMTSFASAAEYIILGNLTFEEKPVATDFTITINNTEVLKTKSHSFAIKLPPSRVYQVTVESPDYYPSVQTFSLHELTQLGNARASRNLRLPDISLVKRKEGRVMFAFGGDVMMGRRYEKPYFNQPVLIHEDSKTEDTKSLIREVKPYMQIADFSAINLETQISKNKPKERAPKSVTFYSPPETLNALKWAGIDYVTLGNNHIYDYLDEGLVSTLDYLEKSGLAYSGAGVNQTEALKPYHAKLGGKQYAMLGFVGWEGGFTPNQVAEINKGGSAFGSDENIIESVSKEALANNPTIVQYHGSLEYKDEPSGMTESRLKKAVDNGADLVIAHHPHVTQGFEVYNGKLIAYSMGNFIFDQYFHSTPHSYILYVWMDGEKFHRAEVVPIYLKGYVPIPATGIQRDKLVKRTKSLSKKRGVLFSYSGGHLVLNQEKIKAKGLTQKVTFDRGERTRGIYQFPAGGKINKVSLSSDKLKYRLGENLLNGGDFETYDLFQSAERSWLLENASLANEQANSGSYSVALSLDKNQSSVVGMQTFRRVFKAANPMTFQAKIFNPEQLVNIKLFLQLRKTRQKFFDAIDNGPKTLIGEVSLNANTNWQNIEFDFYTPRVGYRSYRVLAEVTASGNDKSKNKGQVYLDDLALIQWQAHFNASNTLPKEPSILDMATHIGLEQFSPQQKQATISFE